MINNLGESGLPVCQAGHWDWQRPHSVHDVKSSNPFQVKSSTLPTPSEKSSSRSSISAKSSGLPSTMTGCSVPSAGFPVDSRLNQMFGQLVNRCQATPIVVLSPMTMNQAIEIMILIAAMITIPVSSAAGLIPAGSRNQVSGKCNRVVSAPSSRYSMAWSARMHSTIPRMVSST